MAADGGSERDVVHPLDVKQVHPVNEGCRMNEGCRALGALKSDLSNRGLGIKAKKCLYERVFVPMALHGAEALWYEKC